MDDQFTIFVDRLKKGHVEKVSESLDPSFLDVDERDLSFQEPVIVAGEAYLAEQELIIRLDASTWVKIPCSICNLPVKIPLKLTQLYFTAAEEEYRKGTYSFRQPLREALLLETPHFAECRGGCPKRGDLAPYMKHPKEEGFHPFKDFDFQTKKE